MAIVGVDATRTQVGVGHNFDLKDITIKATIGDDCRTKLMYYLSCFSCISKFCEVHPQWSKYTEYKTCNSWTLEEEEELYHICRDVVTVSKAKEIGFIDVPDGIIGTSNKFYEVTSTNVVVLNQVHVQISANSVYASNRFIGAKSEVKFEIMFYQRCWINNNYYNPLRDLSYMIDRHKREKREAEERRLREIREAEERRERERRAEEERKRREEEERKERDRRRLHNERVLRKNRYCCCLLSKRDDSKHPNLVKFVLILYFIHTVGLSYLYLHANKDLYDENPWLKWVHLAGFIVSISNIVLGIISMVFVCISCCVDKWIVYVRIILGFMMCLSLASIPLSYFMFLYFAISVIQMLISLTMLCFSCVIYKETKVKPACLCLCCGARRIKHDKLYYDL